MESSDIPPRQGSNVTDQKNGDELFLTAIPQQGISHCSPASDHALDPDVEEDLFEDVGYNKLVADFDGEDIKDEAFAKLQSKVDQIRELQQSVNSLKANLKYRQEQSASARLQDEAKQKESDVKMERIKAMEEDADMIHSSILSCKEQAKELKKETDGIKRMIEEGPGWKDDQARKRETLTNAIDHNRLEVTESNAHLDTLRDKLRMIEKEVGDTVKQRDDSLTDLDTLNGKICAAREVLTVFEQKYTEAESSKALLTEASGVANAELADLKAECDSEKQMADNCVQLVEDLQSEQQSCLKECAKQALDEEALQSELKKMRADTKEMEDLNSEKKKELHVLSRDRESLLKDRAKTNKLRELIDQKVAATDKERVGFQKKLDELNIRKTRQENTDVPLARKETAFLKREIKRQEHELDLIGRNIGLKKKSSACVADMIKSNENTVLNQQAELVGMRKASDELQKMRRCLLTEEGRDEERLKRIYEVLQKKERSLKSIEESNRSLETAAIEAEALVAEKHNLCEMAREGHNVESKNLSSIREDVHLARADLVALVALMKSVNEDISRADDLVFKEHSHHHFIDSERACIETDIARFYKKISKLEEVRGQNESFISHLSNELDRKQEQREVLRQKYRCIMGEKDLYAAAAITTEAEHCRINESIETHEILNKENDRVLEKKLDELFKIQEGAKNLLAEKEDINLLLEKQRERSELLAVLEYDLAKQLDKNSALVIEIGKPIAIHRWRYLKDKLPSKFALLENIHNLQRQAITVTDRITAHTCGIEKKKKRLNTIRKEVSLQSSIGDIQNHLSCLKSEFLSIRSEIKSQETKLREQIDEVTDIKSETLKLEKKRVETKAGYMVSVLSGTGSQ